MEALDRNEYTRDLHVVMSDMSGTVGLTVPKIAIGMRSEERCWTLKNYRQSLLLAP